MINFGKSGGSGSGWKIGASTSLTSKRYYKALDVAVNQRIIFSVGIFKEFDCEVVLL